MKARGYGKYTAINRKVIIMTNVDPTKPTGTVESTNISTNEPSMFDSSEETVNDSVASNPSGTDSAINAPVGPVTPTAIAPDDPNNPNKSSDYDNSSDEVVLYMPGPGDTFRYGENEDEVIVGQQGKKFSRSEAEKMHKLAENNNVQLLERGLGELI